MKIKIALGLMLLFTWPAFAGDEFSKVATGTAQFLKLGVGARAVALGDAYSAIANDATAMYWNPAGIQKINGRSVSLSYIKLFADIDYGFLGVVIPFGANSAIGISVLYLSSGDMDVTTIEFPEGTGGTFNTSHSALGITYSRRLTERFDLGITIKYISERLYREEASTLAFDIGSQFDTGIYGLKIGMALANFGGKMKFDGPDLNAPIENEDTGVEFESGGRLLTDEWPLPLLFRLAIAADVIGPDSEFFKDEKHRLTLCVGGDDPVDHNLHYNFGLEYEWNKTLALRAGYKENYDEANFTAGFGIRIPTKPVDTMIDYAFNNYGLLGYVQQFSLEFHF